MVAHKSEVQERKEKKRRVRQERLRQLQERMEKERDQREQQRLQIELQEKQNRELSEELDKLADAHLSRCCEQVDLEIAQAVELSECSLHTDDEDDSVLPEWMHDSSECASLDFGLWRHANGESAAAAWVQVPFNEVRMECAVKGYDIRNNIYTETHAYPKYPSMTLGTICSSPLFGSNWLEVPEPLTPQKSSARHIAEVSSAQNNSAGDNPKSPGREWCGEYMDKDGNSYECIEGRVVIRPSRAKDVVAGRPDDLYGVAEEETSNAWNRQKGLNVDAPAFTPRNPKSCMGSGSAHLFELGKAENEDDVFSDPSNTSSSGVRITSTDAATGISPNATSEEWNLAEESNSPPDSNNNVASVPSRGGSDTNPSELDFNQPPQPDLEAVYNTAMATYQRDIGRLSILASGVRAGCRREVGNGTSYGQEYVSQINITTVNEKFASEQYQVSTPSMFSLCEC
jgi:hypothetical protein